MIEGMAVLGGEKSVHVIGHDDIGQEVIAILVKVLHGGGDDLACDWILQKAGAVACVKPIMNALGEGLIPCVARFLGPGLGMIE